MNKPSLSLAREQTLCIWSSVVMNTQSANLSLLAASSQAEPTIYIKTLFTNVLN